MVREGSQSAAKMPPAYFLRLSITGIKCFGPEQVLDLSDGQGRPARWTIILGDNGTGKTTILQGLAACEPRLARTEPERVYLPRIHRDLLMGWRRTSEDGWGHSSEVAVTIFQGEILARSGESKKIEDLGICYLPSLEDFAYAESIENLGGLVCYGYGATRRMGATSLSEALGEDTIASLFFDDVSLLNAEEWLLQADYAALVESSIRARATRRRDQVIEALVELLPDVAAVRFIRPTEASWQPRVEVQTPYGWVDIQDLSLGYRTLIAWVVDLAYRLFERYPDSPNPLAEPAIVLVDEIDLHLHPRWQRSLMAYLTERFPNTQFIVTAHSPLIVQAATDANIVLLRREGDHVVIDNDVEAIRGWRIDQVLTSDLFGLETARPPEYDALLKERNRILGKAKLTAKDKKRLQELDGAIGDLPTGETPEDIEAMDIIREAAAVLKREGAGGR